MATIKSKAKEAEAAEAKAKEEAKRIAALNLGIASVLGKATLRKVPLSALYVNRNANPRGPEDFKRIPELAEEIAKTGIHTPLLAVPIESDEGKFLVVQGNRRFDALNLLKGRKDFGNQDPKRVPIRLVPTDDASIIRRLYVDVDNTVIPSSWRSEANIVRTLLASGMTENQVAAALDWSRGKVQNRKRLYTMPVETREAIFEYLAVKAKGKEALDAYEGIKFGTKAFHRLSKAWNLETTDESDLTTDKQRKKHRAAVAEAKADGDDWPTLWAATKATRGANFETERKAEASWLSPTDLTMLKRQIRSQITDDTKDQMEAFLLLIDVLKSVDGAMTEFTDKFLV